VWSSPDRAGLVATLRHEGLHQYLDRGVGQAPVWLNEGLAEYFESAKLVRGTLVDGVPQERHVEKLLDPQTTWVPFEELLAMGPAEFYGASALHYAQSWALVHWLQESGLAAGRVFQGLVDDLAAGKPADALGARVLGVDGLLRKVREHVKSLDAASGG
jgi:hypothetical protein